MDSSRLANLGDLCLESIVEDLLAELIDDDPVINVGRITESHSSKNGGYYPAPQNGNPATNSNPIRARKAHKLERQTRVQIVRNTEKALYAELKEVRACTCCTVHDEHSLVVLGARRSPSLQLQRANYCKC